MRHTRERQVGRSGRADAGCGHAVGARGLGRGAGCGLEPSQLERLVVDYIDHYNTHRPHRSLDQRPPVATDASDQLGGHLQVLRTARCGGLINEYRNAA